jgi:hypothetical protein
MAELKTKPTNLSVDRFLKSIPDKQRREDCYTVVDIMRKATKAEPKMWGSSIVGFGSYHYAYASGRELDWFLVGFSPRKQNLTLYIMAGFEGYGALLEKLGKHKTGRSCLYINRLDDVHLPTLKRIVEQSVKHITKRQSPR